MSVKSTSELKNIASDPSARKKILRASGSEDSALAEFSQVVAVGSIEEHGVVIPKGARGAVVHVMRGGAGYEVEFVEPVHAVVAVARGEVTPLG